MPFLDITSVYGLRDFSIFKYDRYEKYPHPMLTNITKDPKFKKEIKSVNIDMNFSNNSIKLETTL